MKSVTIIDYGIGNLFSVARAFEFFDAKIQISDDPKIILAAERLVLPGVGAFSDAMNGLCNRNITAAAQRYAEMQRPFLGICLGMQMMMDESDEFGTHKGLGLIKGRVEKIPDIDADGKSHKVPHVGWNNLLFPQTNTAVHWENTVLKGLEEKTSVYFVHSFTPVPDNPQNRLADTVYGGRSVSAIIYRDYLYGCQFHPEKSGPMGLKIIKNFLAI